MKKNAVCLPNQQIAKRMLVNLDQSSSRFRLLRMPRNVMF